MYYRKDVQGAAGMGRVELIHPPLHISPAHALMEEDVRVPDITHISTFQPNEGCAFRNSSYDL